MLARTKKLPATLRSPPAQSRHLTMGQAFSGNELKTSGVPTACQLAINAQTQAKLAFHREVQEVMRHERVVSRRRIHLNWPEPISVDRDRVAVGACATELNFHGQ